MSINWNQKRNVYVYSGSGEFYVAVNGGYMLDYDYVEGGRVENPDEFDSEMILVGRFTNAQIQNGDYLPS